MTRVSIRMACDLCDPGDRFSVPITDEDAMDDHLATAHGMYFDPRPLRPLRPAAEPPGAGDEQRRPRERNDGRQHDDPSGQGGAVELPQVNPTVTPGRAASVTLKDLYALMLREFPPEYRGQVPNQDLLGLDLLVGPAAVGFRWVMDLDSYKEVRAACLAAGAIYPPGEDPEGWAPSQEDQLFGLPVDVRSNGGPPHLERLR